MNVAELREELKNLVASRIRIDGWGVNMPENEDNPERPASIGLDEPATFTREGSLPGQSSPHPVIVTATFPFQILYQFGSYYSYNQIPRGTLEAKLLELEVYLEHELPCLLGNELAPDTLKLTSSVAIARAENKSWLAVCKFSIRLGLLSELDDFELYAPSISGTGDVTPSSPINPTDSFIPRFTVNPALANPTNTGTLNQLLSWVAGRIKVITGTTNWFDSPATDLATVAAHIADGNNPHEVTVDQIGAVASTDSRLTDTRTPTDGTVTNAKVAPDAAIAWGKVNKAGAVAADVGAVASTDSRLTDTRTPTDGTVTNAKVAPDAAIAWGKVNKAGAVAADVGAIAASARGAANGVAALDSSGRVPAAQSRPSSVSYNSSLGQFTFTWADGSSQTIDTPIENLFQSVAYNPSTQVVTFTLASGSTTTIDLSSLVDLPEVEISNQAPVASPSSGRRVFFNSTSGEYWLNVSSAWTGPFLSFTSAERSKLAGIATGATANSTDAQLRDRSTHTGSQATSTITGLDTALAGFAVSGHSHSNASGSTAGFMSIVDFTKLAGIATGATANSTDAQLRDRSTHTGSQATSTITGLDTALAGFAASGHSHSNASGSTAGFMSIVDFTKLAGIATGATANSTDAQLRDRSTHTGSQATSTITGLDAALAGFAASGHSHSNASGAAAGFMSSADFTKLAGIATGATANSTDAQLRDRSTHTGSQATSTITGLDAALAGFAASGHSHSNASGAAAGFMSSADFTKLAGIATGATANSTDAQLRDRSTHTGSQATSTITGLDAALAGFAASGHSHSNASGAAAGFMSSADFTKLAGIATGATANSTDAQLRDRSTHTGTQANTTITGLGTLSTQNASAVAVTGGAINGTTIGAATPSTVAGTFINGIAMQRTATSSAMALGSVASSTGTGWVALGNNNAALASTTGGNWFAAGLSAGAVNTSGNGWVALGTNAGAANQTGSTWIAIGPNTGASNVSASNWIAIGANAANANTNATGQFVVLGATAAAGNVSGQRFTAVGYFAGSDNTSGNDWVALGWFAGKPSTTGSNWISIGRNSAPNISTGSNWVAIGANTMGGVTTGDGNTVIGANVTGLDPALTNNLILASGDGAQKIRVDSSNAMTILGSLSNPGLSISATGIIQTLGTGIGTVVGNARGAGAVDLQVQRDAATQVAAGPNSVICGGASNRTAGNLSVVGGGISNAAVGYNSFVGGGDGNQANIFASICGGYQNASNGDFSAVAGGQRASAWRYGQQAFSAGRFSSNGDAQISTLIARNITTNASTANLLLDGSGVRILLNNNSSFAYDICISAHSTTNIAEQATFWRRGKIYRGANAAATAIVPGEIADNQANGLPWAVSLSADTTNGALSIVVQGEASKTIRWVARIQAVEVSS